MKKKILLVGSAYPLRGGLASFNERLIREFQSQGHEAQIYTFTLQYPEFLFPGKTQYSSDPRPEDIDIEVCVNSINPFNWIKIGRKIKKIKPDILIFKYWTPFMAPCFGTISLFAKSAKTKVVVICDNIIPHEKHIFDDTLNYYFLRRANAFICMSRSVQKDLLTYWRKAKNILTPHPVYDNYGEAVPMEEAKVRFGLPPDANVLLFFGFIRQYKGLDLLLQAMTDVRIRALNIKAIVAGEFYDDPTPYKKYIELNDLKDSVILHDDFIPNDEVKYYFSAADVVVQPYKTATQSGISQMCYHFEKPMIVTNVGGLPEIVPHKRCGIVCKVSVEAVANAIFDFYIGNKFPEFKVYLHEEKLKYRWSAMTEAILTLTDS